MASSSSSTTTDLLAPVARVIHRIVARECDSSDDSSRCEKPINSPKIIGITCGITAYVHHASATLLLLPQFPQNNYISAQSERPCMLTRIVSSAVLIIGSLCLLTFLHLRRQRFERKEDAIDLEIDGDVDDHPTMGKPPRAWQPHAQRGQANPFEEAERQPHQRENPFEPERR
ncbi:hypothetical protein CSUB01_04316 [Colletotrichum sublineola]|uniref:Uncharacterized protein n=1 Tax=Colletotrichum sublineola TaxID=1173701 RepID=A0A066X6B5_COLSU|nr:hypothetical protein CSUB01_04316 [Colletotrichum sublineola]